MNIKKVDDKPMVILTKEKAKIHSHEPKGTRIKGSNIYTVERGPKIAGAKAAETTGKKSYRKSTVHQAIIIFQIIREYPKVCVNLQTDVR